MRTSIVLGLQYGDEGKGLTTAHLAKQGDLVVRFNGGHQAGHTVVKYGYRHIFSSFGSGTLNGAHTFISEHCTIYPKAFVNEQTALIKNGFSPVCNIHPLAMITTPFDVEHNRSTEKDNQHGSVGVGFGATIARNENTPYKLYAIDLLYKEILIHKLRQIGGYYKSGGIDKKIESFVEYVDEMVFEVCRLEEIMNDYEQIIFEGAQGIMLDMDFGFFPNVTRSNTTSKNAMKIVKDAGLPIPDVYYVMRSYLTRHGNGYMPHESPLTFKDETNVSHKYQGEFRQGYHSLGQLFHAIGCDSIYSGVAKKNLVITCLDQTNSKIFIDTMRQPLDSFLDTTPPLNKIFISDSPNGNLSEYKKTKLQLT